MEEEKRQTVRIKKALIAMYRFHNDVDKDSWDQTQIRDICEKGMLITTMKCFQPNDVLTFLVKLPMNPFQWIEFNGRVVESKDLKTVHDEAIVGTYITRVEFVGIKEEHKELMRVYIAWFLTKKGG